MLFVEISFVVNRVNMGANTEEKEVYVINGYEYTREELDILNVIVESNLP